MVRIAQTVGGFTTQLDGGVSAAATSWVVDSVAGLPTSGDFYLGCKGEIVKVTAISGLTLTVERGQLGTTAAIQGDNVEVYSLFTSEELRDRIKSRQHIGLGQSLPYGRITLNGATLTASDFTLVNGGNSVTDGTNGVIVINSKNHSGNNHLTGATYARATTDFDIHCHLAAPNIDDGISGNTGEFFGLYAHQVSGGQMLGIALGRSFPTGSSRIEVQDKSSFLTTPTTPFLGGLTGRRDCWFRAVRNGNNFTFSYSFDGVHYFEAHTIVDNFGSANVGAFINNNEATSNLLHILAWQDVDA